MKEKEITDPKERAHNIKAFIETLFKWSFSQTNVKKQELFNNLNTKKITNQQSDVYKKEIWYI